MEGHLVMSAKERRRKVEFEGVREGRQNIKEASVRLRLSYRHCRRSYKRLRAQGDKGLVHRSRGRPSNQAKPREFRDAVLGRYHDRYKGFGPTLAAEKLAHDGYELDHETLRRWLVAEGGQWQWQRKGAHHRQRRERRAHFGELVQMDGSHHQWFADDGRFSCLMDMVDDATGETLALMGEQETTELAMQALWAWCERYGIPRALYTDHKNVFLTDREPTIEEQLAGQEPLTAFGKACKKLGIEIIPAGSPQAKGRVERKHRDYQDRFVKELSLEGITTIEGANELLEQGFVETFNGKFARPPRSDTDLHRPVPPELELREVFCFEQTRVVSNDWTVRCENRFYQILKRNDPLPRSRQRVTVRRLLDGTIQLLYHDKKLRFKEIEPPDTTLRYTKPAPAQLPAPRKKHKPAPDHPWRRGRRTAARRTQSP